MPAGNECEYIDIGNLLKAFRRLAHRVQTYQASDWICEHELNSRQFEQSNISRIYAGGTSNAAFVQPERETSTSNIHPFTRHGRGSLRGRVAASPEWDSPEVNDQIAREFGL